MVGVRPRYTGSWLDPNCSGLLGWKLGRRLWERVKGRKGLFLTLTYRRDEYADAQDLYRRQSEEQHVPLFMRKLARRLRMKLTGKWIAKLEFQRGGWVHWHIVLLDVEWVDRDVLAEAWGHGFVKPKALTKKRCIYTCKYISKDDGKLPAWLYLEAPRSVKIIRTSPGFWGETRKARQRRDVELWDDGTVVGSQRLAGCYTPIGVKLKRAGVVVRVGRRSERRTFGIAVEPAAFMVELALRSQACLGQNRGWIWYRCREEDVPLAAAAARRAASPSGIGGAPPPRSGGLNLRGSSNPDAEVLAELIDDVWREDAEQLAEPWRFERLQVVVAA